MDDDAVFVQEVMQGCISHSKTLRAVVEGFYAQQAATALRSDRYLYHGWWGCGVEWSGGGSAWWIDGEGSVWEGSVWEGSV